MLCAPDFVVAEGVVMRDEFAHSSERTRVLAVVVVAVVAAAVIVLAAVVMK